MRPPHAKDPLLDKCEPTDQKQKTSVNLGQKKDKCDLKRGLGWRNPFNLKILFLIVMHFDVDKKKVMFDQKKGYAF